MFKELNKGIYKQVSLPRYGLQDIGFSPAGAMDRFSYETGNALLNQLPDAPALELIYPPRFKIEKEGYFIITGGKHSSVILRKDSQKKEIPHACVVRADAGWTLEFGPLEYGFRTYLCFREGLEKNPEKSPEGRQRPDFREISTWRDSLSRIRVIRGPEFKYLSNPETFLHEGWTVTQDLSDMGMRINSGENSLGMKMSGNMISEAVSDGTVQLTPKGPIILLRHRQTVGGYPRIFNVISADVDLLAQYSAGQVLHFREVTLNDARDAARQKDIEIKKMRQVNDSSL